MLKTLKAVAGTAIALFCLEFLRMMVWHLARLNAPHQTERTVIDAGLAAVCGYAAFGLLAGAFRSDPATERVAADGTLTVGTTLAQRVGESLVVEATPKARWNNAGIFGVWAVVMLLGDPDPAPPACLGWLAFNPLLGRFSLLMLGFTLAHWRDSCVWDRARRPSCVTQARCP